MSGIWGELGSAPAVSAPPRLECEAQVLPLTHHLCSPRQKPCLGPAGGVFAHPRQLPLTQHAGRGTRAREQPFPPAVVPAAPSSSRG